MSRKRARRVEQPARVVDPLSWRPPPQMLELRVFARDEVDADDEREWVERGEEAGAVVEIGRLGATRVAVPPRAAWPQVGLDAESVAAVAASRTVVSITLGTPCFDAWTAVVAATRLASAVRTQHGGVIFDVCALRHLGSGPQPFPWDPDDESILHHVALVCRPQPKRRFDAATRGLVKFGRPELEIRRVPERLVCEAAELLFQVGEYVARGALVIPGDTVGHPVRQLRAMLEESILPLPPFLPVLRLVDAGSLGSPVKGLRAWAGMDAVPGAGPPA